MNKSSIASILISVVTFLFVEGCSSTPRIPEVSVTDNFPKKLDQFHAIVPADANIIDLNQAVGKVIFTQPHRGLSCDSDKEPEFLWGRRFVNKNEACQIESKMQMTNRFQGLIDADIQKRAGTLLANFSLDESKKVETNVVDIQSYLLNDECIPSQKITDYVEGRETCGAYYVTGLTLTSVEAKYFHKTEGNSAVNGSSIFQMNGLYFLGEKKISTDYYLDLTLMDAKIFQKIKKVPLELRKNEFKRVVSSPLESFSNTDLIKLNQAVSGNLKFENKIDSDSTGE